MSTHDNKSDPITSAVDALDSLAATIGPYAAYLDTPDAEPLGANEILDGRQILDMQLAAAGSTTKALGAAGSQASAAVDRARRLMPALLARIGVSIPLARSLATDGGLSPLLGDIQLAAYRLSDPADEQETPCDWSDYLQVSVWRRIFDLDKNKIGTRLKELKAKGRAEDKTRQRWRVALSVLDAHQRKRYDNKTAA